jgi:hypothetical protein
MQDYVASRTESLRTKRRRKVLLYVVLAILVVLLAGLFFFLRSELFQIRDIRIPDTHSVSEGEIAGAAESFFRSQPDLRKMLFGEQNILFVSSLKLSEKIAETFPSMRRVSVSKKITQKQLVFSFSEREKIGLWCSDASAGAGSSCVWFDREGIAFLNGVQVEGNILYRVLDETGRTVELGKRVLPEHELANLFSVYDFLVRTGWNTKTLVFENEEFGELRTPAVQGSPMLYFSLANDPTYAVETVKKLKEKEDLEYIDLRVQGRVYYK